MNHKIIMRVGLLGSLFGCSLFSYLHTQNEVSKLKMELPMIAKEIESLYSENQKLKFEVECFENPLHLIELARQPQFSHMRFPMENEILSIPPKEKESAFATPSSRWEFPVALGAK